MEPVDKFPSSAAASQRDRGMEEGLPVSKDGQPPVAARGQSVPANSGVGHDEFEYEVPPWTDNYEDVDSGHTYGNDVMVSASHVMVMSSQGYAVMTAASSSTQVLKLEHYVC